MAKYYEKLVVSETPYMSNWMDDTNHIRTYLQDVEPQKFDSIVNHLFTQRQDFETPLLTQLEGGSVPTKLLTGESDSWTWDFEKPLTPAVVTHNGSEGQQTPGKGGAHIILRFDRNWFTYGDVITNDRFSGKKLRVVPEGISRVGNEWEYRLELLTENRLTDYVPQSQLAINTEYIKLYSIYGEFNDQGSKIVHAGRIKMMNSLAGEIRTETAITDWADALTITMSTVIVDENGKLKEVKDSRWFKRNELAAWSEHRRMKENYLMFGTAARNLTGQTAYDVSSGMGAWDMLQLGNVNYYNDFTLNRLLEPINAMYYGRVAGPQRNVDLYTGELGFILFDQGVTNKLGGLGGLVPLDKFISGSGMNMGFGYQFKSYMMPNGGVINLKHMKTLDSWSTRSERGTGKYSKLSGTFIGFDMSNDSRANMQIVKRQTRPDDYWGYVTGTAGPMGPSKGAQGSNKKAGYEMWISSRLGLHIEDVTKTFMLRPISLGVI